MNELLLIAGIIAASSTPLRQAAAPAGDVHGSLIIVSATASSIVIAADSALVRDGKTISNTEKKILPVGRDAACFLTGTIDFWSPDQPERLNLAYPVREWAAKQHLGVRAAYQQVTDLLTRKMVGLKILNPRPDSGVTVGCVGFDSGTPILMITRFHLHSDTDPQAEKLEWILPPGSVRGIGITSVANEILLGRTNALQSFKDEAIVARFRRERNPASLTERDLISLSSVCLKATEAPAGRAFDPHAAGVAAPNHFAVIDQKRGFRRSSELPSR